MSKLIVIVCVAFLLSMIAHDYYMESVDMMNLSEGESKMIAVIGAVRSLSMYGAFFLYVMYVTRRLSHSHTVANKLILFVCILVGLVYCIGMTYMKNKVKTIDVLGDSIQVTHPDFLADYEKYLNTEKAREKDSLKINRMIASSLYTEEGLIVDVLNEDGSRVTYVPSAEDIEMRSNLIRANELINWSKYAMKETVFNGWVFYIFTLFVSFGYLGWGKITETRI